MSSVDELGDDQWHVLKPICPGGGKGKRGPVRITVKFSLPCSGWRGEERAGGICPNGMAIIEALNGVAAVVLRWPFSTGFSRRWGGKPIWNMMIDSTIVRAHQQLEPASKKGGACPEQTFVGAAKNVCSGPVPGPSTKVHAATDALGLPVRLIAGPGQEHDIARAEELTEGLPSQNIIADKGYDAGHLVEKIERQRGSGHSLGTLLDQATQDRRQSLQGKK